MGESFERPDDYAPLGVIPEPERASLDDSEALWALATLLLCVAMTVTAAMATQALTGAHRWSVLQILSPLLAVPLLVVVAAFARAYLPGRLRDVRK